MLNLLFLCEQWIADSVGLPCRLVRGSSYCGKEEDAMVVIKCNDERSITHAFCTLSRRKSSVMKGLLVITESLALWCQNANFLK